MTSTAASSTMAITIPKGRHVSGAARAELIALLVRWYGDGASIRQLADRTGRSYQSIRNMLTEAGVTLRPRGGHRPPAQPKAPPPTNPDTAYAQALGRELRRLRRAKGWTRARVCRDLGISVSTLAAYENGTRALAATRLAELCLVLGTQPHIVLATVDHAALPTPNAVTIDLAALARTTRPDLAPVQRWATTKLRALAPGRPTTTILDTAALNRLATVCGVTTSHLIIALTATPLPPEGEGPNPL